MSKRLKIAIGAISPKLKTQIQDQDYLFSEEMMHHFQLDADAIIRLKVRGIIPPAQIDKACQRLVDRISKHVEKFTDDFNKKLNDIK